MSKKTKRLLRVGMLVGLVGVYLSLDESTKRYLNHIGKQVPYLPYRYFI
jgi:hypothetical protein